MAERIWSSPRLFTTLSGDKDAARRLVRKARVCVGYLFDNLYGDQKYRRQQWRLPSGAMIDASVWRDVLGERAVVRITAPFLSAPVAFVAYNEMQHGWQTKYSVYLTPELIEYFSGQGTERPDNPEEFEYLAGTYETMEESGSSTVHWSKDPPEIGAGNSIALDPDKVIDPDMPVWEWTTTGRLRLFMQSLKAAQRDPRAITLGAGIDIVINPDIPTLSHFGLVHSPNGDMWLANMSAGGLKLSRLKAGPAFEQVHQWLKDGEFADSLDERLAWTWVYAFCELGEAEGGGRDVVTVASAAEVAEVYVGGGYIEAHGWHWHPEDSKAAAVLYRGKAYEDGDRYLPYYETRVVQIEIKWDTDPDSPTFDRPLSSAEEPAIGLRLAIDNGVAGKWRPVFNTHGLWHYAPGVGWIPYYPGNTNWVGWEDEFTGEAPVYCMWRKEAEEWGLKTYSYSAYHVEPVVTKDPFKQTEPQVCGGIGTSETRVTAGTKVVIKGGVPDTDIITGSYTEATRSWTTGGGSDRVLYKSYTPIQFDVFLSQSKAFSGENFVVSHPEVSPCGTGAPAWIDGLDSGDCKLGGLDISGAFLQSVDSWYDVVTDRGGSLRFLVTNDPLVVHSVVRDHATQILSFITTYEPHPDKFFLGTQTPWVIYAENNPTDVRTDGPTAPAIGTWDFGNEAPTWSQNVMGAIVASYSSTLDITPSTARCEVDTPRETFSHTRDSEDWRCTDILPWVDFIQCALNAKDSAGEVCIYQSYPFSDYEGPSNIVDVMAIAADIGWIGGA